MNTKSPKNRVATKGVREVPGRAAKNVRIGGTGPDRAEQRRAEQFLVRLRRAALPAVVALGLSALSQFSVHAAQRVNAMLEPSEIALGEAARLVMTLEGSGSGAPDVPTVDGLSFQATGQSSQIQIINGAMSSQVSYTYDVYPTRVGTFTIPRIQSGNGQPLVLRVVHKAGGQAGAGNQNRNLPSPQTGLAGPGGSVMPDNAERERIGFLRVVSPKTEYFVGETVPVELKACIRAGVGLRVDGLPQLNSEAFTMAKLSNQPSRTQQVIGGVPYTVFSWSTTITAVKAGDYQLGVELPTTVTVRQSRGAGRRGNPTGNPMFDQFFNDSFFDDFFGTATERQIPLGSAPAAVKIVSLPAENRPAGFAGAVGRFEFSAEATPLKVSAGDPVTLKTKITGTGNFDRVTAPTPTIGEGWKSYKANGKFEAEDSAGYAGTKTFEQALIPSKSGEQALPQVAFSFFDPETKHYVTKTASGMKIEVAPGEAAAVQTKAPATAAASSAPRSDTELAPDRALGALASNSLRPWILNPLFWICGLAPAIGLLVAWKVVVVRQHEASDPVRVLQARVRKEVQTRLQLMDTAAETGQPLDFFAAARGALQNQLSLVWRVPAHAISLAEVNTRMNGEAEGFRFIFELADEVAYTGRTFAAGELRNWASIVRSELKKLEVA